MTRWKGYARDCRMKKEFPLLESEVIMGRSLKMQSLKYSCNEYSIKKEFSATKTPQQNGVVERKNQVIQEITRVMSLNKNIPQKFWVEAVNTSCHIRNRIYFQAGTKKTSYEIWREKKPKVKYF